MSQKIKVAIIGAGPAGFFAADKLAAAGYGVAMFNRDIKPGGMAEYGIYPDKRLEKDGLRKQFTRILSFDDVLYYGNTCVGEDQKVTIPMLLDWGFQAILIAGGAQGTKWLGLPGEKLEGVYHAKDVVFFYNRLPPYSARKMHFGKVIGIVGAGNVMVDVTRYLLTLPQVEEVHICVRRGPAEVKFTRKELEYIIKSFNFEALEKEFTRVQPVMHSIGQDPDVEKEIFYQACEKGSPRIGKAQIFMHFMASPVSMQGDEKGFVESLRLEANTLVKDGDYVSAKGLGTQWELNVGTVIFAIGDKVEPKLGIPIKGNEYMHAENPNFPINGVSYEIDDPLTGKPWKGIFVTGWSRIPSNGLVGNAKRDGVNSAAAINDYLQTLDPQGGVPIEDLEQKMTALNLPVVRKTDLERLNADERARVGDGDPELAKYLTNEEMFKVMGLLK